MSLSRPPPLTYRASGVDIERGARLVDRIGPLAAATRRPGVIGGVGGFGALFEVPVDRYRRPLLVSGTDGVGTKLRLAIDAGAHDTVGIDLVAMCVNDVLTLGAEPLYFLDYLAAGSLDVDTAARVIAGIARGCELAGAALIGGETAEMPGMYAAADYDLAGFCVGVVEHDAVVDGARVAPGDAIIGLAADGVHANGFSLVRAILARAGVDATRPGADADLVAALLVPTAIYVRPVRDLLARVPVRAMAHITGGGITENLPRVLPEGLGARLDTGAWPMPAVLDWLQRAGEVADDEMRRTFNCGLGYVLCVAPDDADSTLAALATSGVKGWRVGEVVTLGAGDRRVTYD